ncbi:hypothetical protein BH09MYX1_BH09MYX1_27670 [soil metagenome]
MAGGASCSDWNDNPVGPIDVAVESVESSIDDPAVTPEASALPDADSGKKLGSIGRGKAATSGAVSSTIKVGTLDRTYILSIPVGYDQETPLPLVFAWHGQTGTAAHFRAGDTPCGGRRWRGRKSRVELPRFCGHSPKRDTRKRSDPWQDGKRRSHTPQFKADAVRLVTTGANTLIEPRVDR